MSGSHWVATYVKDRVINYFDRFGMPPFQEIVTGNDAKKKNLLYFIKTDKYKTFILVPVGISVCIFLMK